MTAEAVIIVLSTALAIVGLMWFDSTGQVKALTSQLNEAIDLIIEHQDYIASDGSDHHRGVVGQDVQDPDRPTR